MKRSSPSLATVILAAGASTRLGQPKQRVQLHGETLLARAYRLACSVSRDTIAVLGPDAVAADELPGTATTVINPQPDAGLGRSIKVGIEALAALADPLDGVLLMLVDQYRLDPSSLATLIAAWQEKPQRTVAAAYDDTVGPPVIFPSHSFAMLAASENSSGAKHLLHRARLSGGLSEVPMPLAMIDLDTPADLAALRRYETESVSNTNLHHR